MDTLEAFDRETTTTLPSRSFRTRGPYDSTTVAMHWDETYRDRVRLIKGAFWTEEDYNRGDHPWPAKTFAKHLDPN